MEQIGRRWRGPLAGISSTNRTRLGCPQKKRRPGHDGVPWRDNALSSSHVPDNSTRYLLRQSCRMVKQPSIQSSLPFFHLAQFWDRHTDTGQTADSLAVLTSKSAFTLRKPPSQPPPLSQPLSDQPETRRQKAHPLSPGVEPSSHAASLVVQREPSPRVKLSAIRFQKATCR